MSKEGGKGKRRGEGWEEAKDEMKKRRERRGMRGMRDFKAQGLWCCKARGYSLGVLGFNHVRVQTCELGEVPNI